MTDAGLPLNISEKSTLKRVAAIIPSFFRYGNPLF